jgi:inner membrane protein
LDNLTHSLVGLFLARTGLKYATPRGTAILMVAANAPDFDAICWFWGPAAYIHWHRNITHSLIAIPVMALIAVALVRLLGRKQVRWLPAILIAIVGVASHLILDLTNVYGVRLLLPFSGHWTHWDLTPIVDLIIWCLLGIGLAAPALGRLVGSEIGEHRPSTGGGWALLALLLLTGYDYGRSVLHDRATALMDSRVYNGLSPRRVGAFPEANPLNWRGIAELSNAYVEVPIDLRETFRPDDGVTWYKAERTPAVNAAMATFPFQRLLEFVQYPRWVTAPESPAEHTTRVSLIDLRFGTPEGAAFSATAIVNARNQVIESQSGSLPVLPRIVPR